MTHPFRAGAVGGLCLAMLAAESTPAAPPALDDVLRRMHATVVEHEDDLGALMSEEAYEQKVLDPAGTTLERRVLRSQYLVFQLPPAESWLACRDVFEVDGSPIPGHRERLEHVLDGPGSPVDLAYRLYEESARYNIGNVVRTFNLPTFALAFFRPAYRRHLLFTKGGEEEVGGIHTWVIRFQERGPAVFVATPSGKGLPVRGRVWVIPEDGRIVRTEAIVGGDGRTRDEARVTTTFRHDASLQLWVPDTMDERYEVPRRHGRSTVVVGHAAYSKVIRLEFKGRLRPQQLPASIPPELSQQPGTQDAPASLPPPPP